MKAWDNFLKIQERELGVDTVNKWLRPLTIVRFDACNLYLTAKDAFQVMWFEEHIRKKIKNNFFNNNQKEIKVHITISGGNENFSPKKREIKEKAPELKTPAFSITFDEPDPLATFDNYIESESSILAYKLLCKITNYDPISKSLIRSESELAAFNPLFLFGGEGTGKTHLLMATAHALKAQGMKILFVRAQTFTEHVVTAIRAGEMSVFRQAYRNIDVLLIDDVHLFSRKGATQEELFHTFNTLHLAGKQIILAANCSPAELQNIEPRLVSRFEWGIVLPLEPIKGADIEKVLLKKAEALDVTIQPKVTQYLLSTFTNSTKTLTQALEILIMRTHLKTHDAYKTPSQINVQLAKHLLKDLVEGEELRAITAEKIINAAAEYFGIKVEDIFGKAQSRDCVLPRQLAMYFCRSKLKMPFKKIGDYFFRDHSTVMSSVKLIEKNIKNSDKEVMGPYVTISKMLTR